jgi:hypothetical protein
MSSYVSPYFRKTLLGLNGVADNLLRKFVTEAADLYGSQTLVYTMQSLVRCLLVQIE